MYYQKEKFKKTDITTPCDFTWIQRAIWFIS